MCSGSRNLTDIWSVLCFLKICFCFLLLFAGSVLWTLWCLMRAVFDLCDLCVCAQLGQPLFHREEITLHLSTSSGDVAKPGEKNQNSNQKVKAGKDAFYGGDFLLCCWFVVFLWLFPPLFLVVVAGILLFCFVFLSGFRCSFCNHFPLGQSSARCSPSLSPSCRAQTLLCKRHLLPNHLL